MSEPVADERIPRADRLARMRDEWNAIAKRNAYWGVMSHPEFSDGANLDEEAFWRSGRRDVDAFLERLALGDTSESSMVEIGCGLGRMTHAFARRFAHVHAIDVSPEMIAQSRAQWSDLANATFVLGNGNDLPGIADGSIDFVFSYIVLQHIPDPAVVCDYVRETARVLGAGGTAYLQLRTDVEAFEQEKRARSLWRSALRRPGNTALRLLKRLVRDPFFPERVPLEQDFGRLDSWQGCALRHEDVERLIASLGMSIEAIDGLGTKYTFYRLRASRSEAARCCSAEGQSERSRAQRPAT